MKGSKHAAKASPARKAWLETDLSRCGCAGCGACSDIGCHVAIDDDLLSADREAGIPVQLCRHCRGAKGTKGYPHSQGARTMPRERVQFWNDVAAAVKAREDSWTR